MCPGLDCLSFGLPIGNETREQDQQQYADQKVCQFKNANSGFMRGKSHLLTSFAALRDHFGVSAKAPADSPELSACPHLKKDLVKSTPRRAKHHLTHTSVERALMAGTPEATARWIKVH